MGNFYTRTLGRFFRMSNPEGELTFEEFQTFLANQNSQNDYQHMSSTDFNIYIRRKIFIHQRRRHIVQVLEQDISMYENQIALLQTKLKLKQDNLVEGYLAYDGLETSL